MKRAGFTLIETMIALSLFALISAGVLTAFSGLSRMIKTTFTEAEYSLAMHDLHERIRFRLDPGSCPNGVAGMSILSADNVALNCCGTNFVNSISSYQLTYPRVMKNNGRLELDNLAVNGNWLFPGCLAIGGDSEWKVRNNTLEVELNAKPSGDETRRYRFTVPVFGRIQSYDNWL